MRDTASDARGGQFARNSAAMLVAARLALTSPATRLGQGANWTCNGSANWVKRQSIELRRNKGENQTVLYA